MRAGEILALKWSDIDEKKQTIKISKSYDYISKKGFHFHSLRHCHVAYLVAHHVDWYEISKRLGHFNLGITMDTYSYMIDELKATQQKLLANALDSMNEPQKLHLA